MHFFISDLECTLMRAPRIALLHREQVAERSDAEVEDALATLACDEFDCVRAAAVHAVERLGMRKAELCVPLPVNELLADTVALAS